MDKDIELLKVKILKDDWQASINSGTSLVIAALVSFIILILTLFYKGTLSIVENRLFLEKPSNKKNCLPLV